MSLIKPFTGVDDRSTLSECIPLDTPYTIGIAPSNACNFKCNYCVQSMDQNFLKKAYNFKRDTMTFGTFKNVVDQLRDFPRKIKLLTFMGQGEPLLNKNIAKMISYAKEKEIAERIDIVTNASLLTKEKSDELLDAGLDVLRISLQGITSEHYKKTSNIKLVFNELVENIKYFYEKSRGKCEIFVKIMNTSLEEGQEQDFYKLFENITDRMFIEQLKPVYNGVDYSNYNYDLATDRRGNTIDINEGIVCSQCFFTLSIWPDGFVNICSAIHKINILGNVNSGNLLKMWHSSKLKKFHIMQLKKLRNTHPQCKLCYAPLECAHKSDFLDKDAERLLNEKYR